MELNCVECKVLFKPNPLNFSFFCDKCRDKAQKELDELRRINVGRRKD